MNRRHFLTATAASTLAMSARSADATAKLKVAIIGHTGHGNYGHGVDTMWLKVPETEIVGVADADEKGLAAELKKLKVNNGFADYHAMLEKVKPDIVAIGPRHIDEHRDMILASVAVGARGIYMEKPFCRSPKEADEIVAACDGRGVKLAVAHRNRYHPVLPVLQQLIKDGAIGRVLEYRARGKEDNRGGSLDLWVLGTHLSNLICYFGGDPVACSATVLQGGKLVTKDDVKQGDEGIGPLAGNEVHARFELTGGIPAFFDSVQNSGTRDAGFGLQIIGTEGIIDLRIDKEPVANILVGSPFNPAKPARHWVPVTTAGIGKPEPEPNIKDVMEHLTGARDLIAAMRENRQPLCSARDARTTIEMVCAVFESHRLNGQRVTFPLQTRENPCSLL